VRAAPGGQARELGPLSTDEQRYLMDKVLDRWSVGKGDGPEGAAELVRSLRDNHLAGYFHLLEPDSPEVLLFLRLMARAIAADAARTIPGGGPVLLTLAK
jgi:hypothetical protein